MCGSSRSFQSAVAHELISNIVEMADEEDFAAGFQSAVAHELISNSGGLLVRGRRHDGFQSAVAHELISNQLRKSPQLALGDSFKALSRMSSFPTGRAGSCTPDWPVSSFKALSRMSSFPTT